MVNMDIGQILYIILGWLIAIGINQAADILPKKENWRQLPKCMHCGAPKPVRAWSGLIGFLTRQKVCPHCSESYSLRYVIIELLMPILYAYLYRRYGYSLSLGFISLYTVIMMLVMVTDLEHRLILNAVMLPAILAAIAGSFLIPGVSWKGAMVGGAIGFLFFYIAALIYRGGLGAGDVTFATFMGLVCGFPGIVSAIIITVLSGGLGSLLLLLSKKVSLKSSIPYGPFLVIGAWSVMLWGKEILRLYLRY
jgi:leader peptidase (prepilin peptidase) / N-methyltransferase